MLEPLLVAQFHAREIEHAVLHGAEHFLAPAGAGALIKRCDNAQRQMKPGAGIADLRAGHQRRPVAKAGRRRRAAGALGDILVDLAVFVGPRPKTLYRSDDHPRIEFVNMVEGKPHAVERAGREILDQHVALLDQPIEDFLALGVFAVDRDRPLAAIEHGEIKAVGTLHVAELAARDVAAAGPFHLDHVSAHIGQKLRAGRSRLHVRKVEDAHAVQRPARFSPWL